VRYHFLRDNVDKGKITFIHVPTDHQIPRSSNFHSFAGGAWCLFDFLSWCVGAPL
jgi:hypothetical protein